MSKFNVGDTVYLLPNAHASEIAAGRTPELFLAQLEEFGKVAYDSAFIVVDEVDEDGDVRVMVGDNDFYVLAKFLTDYKHEESTPESVSKHMELGKTYKSQDNDLYYRPTEFDFEGGLILFDFGAVPHGLYSPSRRIFDQIEGEFGVLPPVKPVSEALEELRVKLQEPVEKFLDLSDAPVPDERPTVQIEALSEAAEFLELSIYNLLALAKRLEK